MQKGSQITRSEKSIMMIKKVISGGQTGADQAGLKIAKLYKIETGGYAPKGFITKDGPNRTLLQKVYGLTESDGSYKKRTWENVESSDGTIRLAVNFTTTGEICTLNGIKKYKKPWIDVDLLKPRPVKDCFDWLVFHQIEVLNIAGNTQNTLGFDIYKMTCEYLKEFFKLVKRGENK